MTLREDIEAAERHLERLKLQLAGATCDQAGHTWRLIGGINCANAGGAGDCSVGVHECERCKDCDYGDNDEARQTVAACRCGEGRE